MPKSQTYYTSLTDYGLEAVQKASFISQPLNITHLAIGDSAGSYYEPSGDMIALKGEKYRGEINRIYQDKNNPSLMIFEAIIPYTSGGYTIREAGLFDEDGKLFAIAKLAETVKPKSSEGEAKELYIRLIIEISNAANITFNMNSSAVFATHEWVTEYTDKFATYEWVTDNTIKKIIKNKEYRVPSQYATVQDCLADLHGAIITDDVLVSIILEKGLHIWDRTVEVEHVNGSRIQIIGEEVPTAFPTDADFTGDKATDEAMVRECFPVIIEFTGEGNALQVTAQLGRIANMAFIDKSNKKARSAILAGDNNYEDIRTLKGTRQAGIAMVKNFIGFGFGWTGITAHYSYVRCLPTTACVYNGTGFTSAQMGYLIAENTLSMYNSGHGYSAASNSYLDISGSKALKNNKDGINGSNAYIDANRVNISQNGLSGLYSRNSVVSVEKVIANENSHSGVISAFGSYTFGNWGQFHKNGRHGLEAYRGGFIHMSYLDIQFNEVHGIHFLNVSNIQLNDCTISHNKNLGIYVDRCGSITANNSTIKGNGNRPVSLHLWGQIEFLNSEIEGTPNPEFNVMNSYGGIIRKA